MTKRADARLDRLQEEKECEEFEAAEKRRRKHDPRQLEVLSSVTGAADQASLMATFAELNLRSAKNEKEWFVGQPAPKWPDRKGVEKLKTELGDVMEHRGTIKVGSHFGSEAEDAADTLGRPVDHPRARLQHVLPRRHEEGHRSSRLCCHRRAASLTLRASADLCGRQGRQHWRLGRDRGRHGRRG